MVAELRQRTLRQVLEDSTAHGDDEHLVFGDQRWSFKDHFQRAAGVAHHLRDTYGVEHGDRVAVFAGNGTGWLATFWASVSLGALFVGCNSLWVTDELANALDVCEPKVVVADAQSQTLVPQGAWSVLSMEDLLRVPPMATLPPAVVQPDDPADIQFTSGTSGRPKAVVHSHGNNIALINSMVAKYEAAGRWPDALPETVLCTSPMFHLTGLHAGSVIPLALGQRVVWAPGRFDADTVLDLIESERCNQWASAATPVARVARRASTSSHDLTSMTWLSVGAGAVVPDLLEEIGRVFPNAAASAGNAYGLTETTGVGTKCSDPHAPAGCVGFPSPFIEFSIRDAEGRVVPDGTHGEVCLRGPSVMLGYYRQAREGTFYDDGWLRTGDLGFAREGQLHLNGRRSDLIIRGGENVYPAEVERVLQEHPDVVEAAVFGVDDSDLGQLVAAITVLADGASPDESVLRDWCRERLAYYKVPALWSVRSDPLLRTATGKIRRDVLRAAPEKEDAGGG